MNAIYFFKIIIHFFIFLKKGISFIKKALHGPCISAKRMRVSNGNGRTLCAPTGWSEHCAQGGSPHPPLSRSPANFAKQIRRRSACRRLSSLEKANVLRTSPFSVIMLFRMIVGLLLASPVKWEKICKQIGPPMAVEGFLQIRPRERWMRRAPLCTMFARVR